MKKHYFIISYILLLIHSNDVNAQKITDLHRTQIPSVEKSIFEIQISPIMIWAVYEKKLSKHFTLRGEAGMNFLTLRMAYVPGIFDIVLDDWVRPSFVLEPRWYYNLNAREKRGHSITNNSAAFLSLPIHYRSQWVITSGFGSFNAAPEIEVVPTIGARYATGKHFSFEYGLGIGCGYYFDSDFPVYNNIYVATNLHFRLGYQF